MHCNPLFLVIKKLEENPFLRNLPYKKKGNVKKRTEILFNKAFMHLQNSQREKDQTKNQ